MNRKGRIFLDWSGIIFMALTSFLFIIATITFMNFNERDQTTLVEQDRTSYLEIQSLRTFAMLDVNIYGDVMTVADAANEYYFYLNQFHIDNNETTLARAQLLETEIKKVANVFFETKLVKISMTYQGKYLLPIYRHCIGNYQTGNCKVNYDAKNDFILELPYSNSLKGENIILKLRKGVET